MNNRRHACLYDRASRRQTFIFPNKVEGVRARGAASIRGKRAPRARGARIESRRGRKRCVNARMYACDAEDRGVNSGEQSCAG